jgi:hypothetical protein
MESPSGRMRSGVVAAMSRVATGAVKVTGATVASKYTAPIIYPHDMVDDLHKDSSATDAESLENGFNILPSFLDIYKKKVKEEHE